MTTRGRILVGCKLTRELFGIDVFLDLRFYALADLARLKLIDLNNR